MQSGEYIYIYIYIYICDPQQFEFIYDIFNTIVEHNQRQTHYLASILNYDICF